LKVKIDPLIRTKGGSLPKGNPSSFLLAEDQETEIKRRNIFAEMSDENEGGKPFRTYQDDAGIWTYL